MGESRDITTGKTMEEPPFAGGLSVPVDRLKALEAENAALQCRLIDAGKEIAALRVVAAGVESAKNGINDFAHDIATAVQYAGAWGGATFAADVLEAVKERHNAYVSEADENARLTAGFAQAREEVASLQRRVKGLEAVLEERDQEIASLQARAASARLEYATLEAKMEFAESLLRDALRGGR